MSGETSQDAHVPQHAAISRGVEPSRSAFALLGSTPMRDLLRGRLSGRLDLERMIAAAQFPTAVADTTRTVVRRTRLSRLEKSDLTSELIAHFRDGLDAGAKPDEIVRSFGDVRQAARLMRRAKRRGRHPVWKAWSLTLRTITAIFVLLLVVYTVQAIRVFSATPVLKLNVLAEINASALALPEEQRAWRVYRAAALAMTTPALGLDLRGAHPGNEHWDAAVAYVAENAEALEQIRVAAAMPRIGVVYSTMDDSELSLRHAPDREAKLAEARASQPEVEENPSAFQTLLPQLSVLREAAHMLRIDALVAADRDESERVMSDVRATLGIVEHTAQMPFLISDLVSLAILNMTDGTIGRLLAGHPGVFSDAQLAELSHRLAGAREGKLDVDIDSERWMFEDILQRAYSDDGAGDGYLTDEGATLFMHLGADPGFVTPEQLLAPAASLVLPSRSQLRAKYDELLTHAERDASTPIWLRDVSAADAALEKLSAGGISRLRYFPIVVLMPSLWRAGLRGWESVQRRDATLAALTLELYRREHGEWPTALDALSPRYLPTIPLDQFDGQPLKYLLVDGQPLLYSIGVDRKDDQGRIDSGPSGILAPRDSGRRRKRPPQRGRRRVGVRRRRASKSPMATGCSGRRWSR